MKTVRFQTKRLATTALLAILAAAALAQGPGGQGGPGGPGGPGQGGPGGMRRGPGQALDRLPSLAQLAGRPEVVAELGLTDDQKQAIDDAVDTMQQSMRPPQGGDGDGPPDFQAMQAARAKAEADADAKVKAKLSDAQVKRLTEIQIQSMGLTAALVPSVQEKLGLSDDQKAQLKALIPARGQGGPGMGGPGGGGPGGGQGGPPDMQGGQGGPPPDMQGGQGGPGGPGGQGGRGGMNGRRQIETKIAAILTDDQKASLKALGGKTIKLAQPQGRGPGGPGMGGPGGGGPGGGQGGPPPMDPR